MSQHDEDFDAGKRAAARELQPLVDAISEAIFLFNDVGQLSSPTDQNSMVRQRALKDAYLAMGKQLDRLLRISPLRHLIPEPKQAPPPRPEPSAPFRKG
jgi:hypothetical protein